MSDTVKAPSKKDMFGLIAEYVNAVGPVDGFDTDAIVAFCTKEITTLEDRAVKARERSAKKRAEAEPDALYNAVFAVLTDEPATREQVFEALNADDFAELSIAKVQYRLVALARDGKAVKSSVKVDGKDRTAYALA